MKDEKEPSGERVYSKQKVTRIVITFLLGP